MSSEFHDMLAARIEEVTSDTDEQGAILISTAHRLGLACAVFTPEEMGDIADDHVEEGMIEGGWRKINDG